MSTENVLKTEKVLGVKINPHANLSEVVSYIENYLLKDSTPHIICTTNPEFVMTCQEDIEFKTIVNDATLSTVDGVGVGLALEYAREFGKLRPRGKLDRILKGILTGSRVALTALSGSKLSFGYRVTGVALVDALLKRSSEKNYSVFLLGGWPKDTWGNPVVGASDLATKTADIVRQKYPNVHIIGSTSQFSYRECDDVPTLQVIRESMQRHGLNRLDLLFVAYNHPKQEKWLKRNLHKIPASVGIGVGGTFDYIAGIKTTSPAIFRQYNIEWLFRLFTQPWRLKRILAAFPIFPIKVFLESIKHNNTY